MFSFRTVRTGTLLFLLIGFSFTTTSALAFWQEVTVTNEVEVTTIGSPVEILVTDLNLGDETIRLVPKGYAISVGDVERIELYYDIGVSRELLNQVDLHITINDILIDGLDTYGHLVKVSVMGIEGGTVLDLYNDTITITITVELLEPIDMAEAINEGLDLELVNVDDAILAFEEIKGKQISFILELELKNKEVIN